MRLAAACDRSDTVDVVARIHWSDGWWWMANRAGVVSASGATCQAMCEDLLGPIEVNP